MLRLRTHHYEEYIRFGKQLKQFGIRVIFLHYTSGKLIGTLKKITQWRCKNYEVSFLISRQAPLLFAKNATFHFGHIRERAHQSPKTNEEALIIVADWIQTSDNVIVTCRVKQRNFDFRRYNVHLVKVKVWVGRSSRCIVHLVNNPIFHFYYSNLVVDTESCLKKLPANQTVCRHLAASLSPTSSSCFARMLNKRPSWYRKIRSFDVMSSKYS